MVGRRGRVLGVALAGLLLVGGLGACGGGEEAGAYGLSMPTTTTEPGPELSAEERAFVEAGTAICREEIAPFANLPDLRSYEGVLDRVRALDTAVAAALLRLHELTPPPGWEARVEAMLTAVAEMRDALVDMVAAADARDQAAYEAAGARMGQEALEVDLLSIAAGLPGCAG